MKMTEELNIVTKFIDKTPIKSGSHLPKNLLYGTLQKKNHWMVTAF